MICVTRARIFWEPNPLPLGTIEDGRKKYGMPQMANKIKAVSSTSAETTKGIGIFFIANRVTEKDRNQFLHQETMVMGLRRGNRRRRARQEVQRWHRRWEDLKSVFIGEREVSDLTGINIRPKLQLFIFIFKCDLIQSSRQIAEHQIFQIIIIRIDWTLSIREYFSQWHF